MSDGRWRISVTAPDWGENHLALDAIVAFVDEELEPGPQARAIRHVARCPECAAQVIAQTQARVALRTAAPPRLPSSLLSSLRSIPQNAGLPPSPSGLAMSEDGEIVYRARPERSSRRARPDAGPPAGLPAPAERSLPERTDSVALGAAARSPGRLAVGTPPGPRAPEPPAIDRPTPDRHGVEPGDGSPTPRRFRLGTGVAVSGLALGALAFGVTAAAPSELSPSVEHGVLGGSESGFGTAAGRPALSSAGLVEAPLRLGDSRPEAAEPAVDGLRELGGLPGVTPLRGLW